MSESVPSPPSEVGLVQKFMSFIQHHPNDPARFSAAERLGQIGMQEDIADESVIQCLNMCLVLHSNEERNAAELTLSALIQMIAARKPNLFDELPKFFELAITDQRTALIKGVVCLAAIVHCGETVYPLRYRLVSFIKKALDKVCVQKPKPSATILIKVIQVVIDWQKRKNKEEASAAQAKVDGMGDGVQETEKKEVAVVVDGSEDKGKNVELEPKRPKLSGDSAEGHVEVQSEESKEIKDDQDVAKKPDKVENPEVEQNGCSEPNNNGRSEPNPTQVAKVSSNSEEVEKTDANGSGKDKKAGAVSPTKPTTFGHSASTPPNVVSGTKNIVEVDECSDAFNDNASFRSDSDSRSHMDVDDKKQGDGDESSRRFKDIPVKLFEQLLCLLLRVGTTLDDKQALIRREALKLIIDMLTPGLCKSSVCVRGAWFEHLIEHARQKSNPDQTAELYYTFWFLSDMLVTLRDGPHRKVVVDHVVNAIENVLVNVLEQRIVAVYPSAFMLICHLFDANAPDAFGIPNAPNLSQHIMLYFRDFFTKVEDPQTVFDQRFYSNIRIVTNFLASICKFQPRFTEAISVNCFIKASQRVIGLFARCVELNANNDEIYKNADYVNLLRSVVSIIRVVTPLLLNASQSILIRAIPVALPSHMVDLDMLRYLIISLTVLLDGPAAPSYCVPMLQKLLTFRHIVMRSEHPGLRELFIRLVRNVNAKPSLNSTQLFVELQPVIVVEQMKRDLKKAIEHHKAVAMIKENPTKFEEQTAELEHVLDASNCALVTARALRFANLKQGQHLSKRFLATIHTLTKAKSNTSVGLAKWLDCIAVALDEVPLEHWEPHLKVLLTGLKRGILTGDFVFRILCSFANSKPAQFTDAVINILGDKDTKDIVMELSGQTDPDQPVYLNPDTSLYRDLLQIAYKSDPAAVVDTVNPPPVPTSFSTPPPRQEPASEPPSVTSRPLPANQLSSHAQNLLQITDLVQQHWTQLQQQPPPPVQVVSTSQPLMAAKQESLADQSSRPTPTNAANFRPSGRKNKLELKNAHAVVRGNPHWLTSVTQPSQPDAMEGTPRILKVQQSRRNLDQAPPRLSPQGRAPTASAQSSSAQLRIVRVVKKANAAKPEPAHAPPASGQPHANVGAPFYAPRFYPHYALPADQLGPPYQPARPNRQPVYPQLNNPQVFHPIYPNPPPYPSPAYYDPQQVQRFYMEHPVYQPDQPQWEQVDQSYTFEPNPQPVPEENKATSAAENVVTEDERTYLSL